MGGESLTYKLRNLLQEVYGSSFLDDRTSYDYIYEAVKEFARRTRTITATQTITTVASTSAYDVNPDFLDLYFRNSFNELVIKYVQASGGTYWPIYRDYDRMTQDGSYSTASAPVPTTFSIIDKADTETRLTGTATSTGTLTNGETVLYDTSASFTSKLVGSDVHNTTDGSSGVVIGYTSSTEIICVLFGGTDNTFTSADAYIIIPKQLKSLVVSPANSVAGDTITLYYIQSPQPVYSPYRNYRIDSQYDMSIVMYAAWLYKYRDRDPNFGDSWYKHWELTCRRAIGDSNKMQSKTNFRVNFMKRSLGNRSYR
jgi:hypothetical protein